MRTLLWSASAGSRVSRLCLLLTLVLAAGPAPEASSDETLTDLERSTAAAVDAYRQQQKLGTLTWNDAVAEQARAHSQAMASGSVGFEHEGFQARATAIAQTLRLAKAAENIFRANSGDKDPSQLALVRWRESDMHRKNMRGEFTITGVGAARADDGEIFLTQLFVALRTQPAGSP